MSSRTVRWSVAGEFVTKISREWFWQGDVVLIKDDGALWAILGYMKEEE